MSAGVEEKADTHDLAIPEAVVTVSVKLVSDLA